MASIKVGDKVTAPRAEYNYKRTTHLASFVRKNTYDVIQVGGKNLPDDRVVIGFFKPGGGYAVTAAVRMEDLELVGKPTPLPASDIPAVPANPSPTSTSSVQNNSSRSSSRSSRNVSSVSGGSVAKMSSRYRANSRTGSGYDINEASEALKNNGTDFTDSRALDRSDPKYVQNPAGFPSINGFNHEKGYYKYNYYMDYDTDKLTNHTTVNSDLEALHKSVNIDVMSRRQLFKNYTERYNRFKVDNPNDQLAKSFAHVFFVRPDCNIYDIDKKDGHALAADPILSKHLTNLSEFAYAKKHSPELLRQLTQTGSDYTHEFMLLPSNKIRTFEIADEFITTDQYGKGLTGYMIPYGKSNVESRTSKSFSIRYIDDRDLHIYNLHKLWIDYISYVFRGRVYPKKDYIMNKILDYATCVYYILCAEDGETIIFWSKYWGVFPKDAPSSSFSYNADVLGGVKSPEINIEYDYAWKEDFNPLSLVEFNNHCKSTNFSYLLTHQPSKLGTGYAWSGVPFIETIEDPSSFEVPYTFKLRFKV